MCIQEAAPEGAGAPELNEFDHPLSDAFLEQTAVELADDLWRFGQTGESEISFARRLLRTRLFELIRHLKNHAD